MELVAGDVRHHRRDVKSNVEGYSEMSDEAFARRFYSDRAELTALGVPLQSQRDDFTGEELYTLRSENYFLDRLDLDDDELAALQTALYYLEGKFAYAEPFRLALQNLALGRAGFPEPPTDTAERVRVSAPDYSPELAGRLAKLESAISKQRTVRFGYWSPRRARPGERTVNPYALRLDDGNWYVVGHDLDRATTRTFKVSRIRGDIRFATRRERDFRIPGTSTSSSIAFLGRGRSVRSSDARESGSRVTPPGGSNARCPMRDRSRRRLRDRLCERRPAGQLGPAPERPRDPVASPTSSSTRCRTRWRLCRNPTTARLPALPVRSGRTPASLYPSVRQDPWHRSASACCKRSSRISYRLR